MNRLSGAITQRASERNGAYPSSISISTRARRLPVSRMSLTWPTGAPAILTTLPGTSDAALSKTASTR
jgi:hypothetical protein